MGSKKRKTKKEKVVKTSVEKDDKKKDEVVSETKASPEVVSETEASPKSDSKKKTKSKEKVSSQVEEYFSKYLQNINSNKVNEAIKALSGLFLQLLSKGNPDDLMYVLNQFKKNKEKLLDIRIGLQGIFTLKPTIRPKVETLFILFYNLSLNKDTKIDFNRIKSILKNDRVVNWFSSKMKQNKLKKK